MSELLADVRAQVAARPKPPVAIRMHSEDAKDLAQFVDPDYDRDSPLVNPQLYGIPLELDDDPFILGFPQAVYAGEEDRDPDDDVQAAEIKISPDERISGEFFGRVDDTSRYLYPRLVELEKKLIAEGATDQFPPQDAFKVRS